MVSLRRSALLLVLGFSMVVVVPVEAERFATPSVKSPTCITEFGRAPRRAEFAAIADSNDLPPLDPRLSQLDPHVAKFLRVKNSPAWEESRVIHSYQFLQNPMAKVGDKIPVGRRDYEVIARLGQGREANVYLVQTSDGLRVAKVYFNQETFMEGWRDLRKESVLRAPKVISTDIGRKTMLLEYLEVVPVEEIETHFAALGISASEKDNIMARWAQEKLSSMAKRKILPHDFNVGYSFREDNFQMFDTH